MTLIPRRAGRRGGLDHFGIEVADFDKARGRIEKDFPDIEVVKRPGNRPFASFSTHDPAGNYFDLSQKEHENRNDVYNMEAWDQDIRLTHFALRVREPRRVTRFYQDVFELETRNAPAGGGTELTDGRMTLVILPWKISDFNGSGIEQPALDHIGFEVPDMDAFRARVEKLKNSNPHLSPRPIDFNEEGKARLALLKRCPRGSYHMADPDGTLIDVAQRH